MARRIIVRLQVNRY